eukprot:TRINITY_DN1639_c0_g1_i2.p1 TRINITY_DN1639_c0_g1~~TRINITY_DN1639_c0_g1_i2.p1  ORF type:complete len:539 (+),score=193.79 TRINITY_DN1639_c0_g1_i2:63-1679(+)
MSKGTPSEATVLDPGAARRSYSSADAECPLPADKGRFGNPRLRWTVLYALLIVAIATMPAWLSVLLSSNAYAVTVGAVSVAFSLVWVIIAINAVRNYRKLNYAPVPRWQATQALRERRFKHIVIVPCYLDPLEILLKCIGTLADQKDRASLVVVVTFEATTPELAAKQAAVAAAFDGVFGDLLVVVHTVDRETEIAGGCSNKNFALRQAFLYCREKHAGRGWGESGCRYTLTTCDTDSLYHPYYFQALEMSYNAANPEADAAPQHCVWQPPLFYNWDLDKRPFFNRTTHVMRMMMMLGGLISFNLNPMSVFSYPMELGFAAGFINPRYGVDDIIAKVRWMCDTNSKVPVKLLPVPVISGPTVGTTVWEEATEWGRQIRRWIVGSSETFHYFVIHYRFTPCFSGVVWFFTFFCYYGVLLCCAGIFNVLAAVPFPWVSFPVYYGISLQYVGAAALGLQMLAFAVGFALDAAARPMLGVKESIHPVRNFLHWLTSPLVLLLYSLIAFASIVRFVFEGKKMARHDMAAKEGFAAKTREAAEC